MGLLKEGTRLGVIKTSRTEWGIASALPESGYFPRREAVKIQRLHQHLHILPQRAAHGNNTLTHASVLSGQGCQQSATKPIKTCFAVRDQDACLWCFHTKAQHAFSGKQRRKTSTVGQRRKEEKLFLGCSSRSFPQKKP